MKRFFGSTAVLALTLAAALPAYAQDVKPEIAEAQAEKKDMKEVEMKAMAGSAAAVRGEIVRQIEDAEKKLLALAEAVPADKFAWRPAEGVRSVGEVFAHVSGGNYFLPTFWGAKMPEGLDPRSFEKVGSDKAKTVDTLKKSFAHVKQAIAAVPDSDLDRTVKFFGQEGSVRTVILILATHGHEHLGQAIAYARMNGVAPPWSAQ